MAGVIAPPTVNGISHHAVAEVFQVHADLVCAARFRVALHEGLALAGFEDAVERECFAAALDGRHFLAVDGMAADGGLDFAMGHPGDPIDESEVGFLHFSGGELIGERTVGLLGFRDDKTSRGLLVEAVDDSRPLRASDDFYAHAVVKEAVGEGAFAVASARVDDEPCGFVDHQEVVVLEKNSQRNILRRERGGGGLLRDFQNHGVALAQNKRGLGGGAVHEGPAIANEPLQARARKIGAPTAEEPVESHVGIGRRGDGFQAVCRKIGHGFKLVQFLHSGKLPSHFMSGREFTHPPCGDRMALLESCPACGEVMDMGGMQLFTRVACSSCGKEFIARRRLDHFSILEPLAEGGIGAVYRAIDMNLDREVALKILKLERGDNVAGADALEQEARAMAGLLHPNIVRVFDFGRSRGVFYMAMEFLSGGSLDDLIQAFGTVDEAQVLQIGIQVAEGLEAASQEGLLHRDIKPANILFSDSRAPKLVDFGPGAKSLGEIWGTPHYIAPEKLDERPEDFRSDIYSLGATLFHALAGRPPYETENVPLAELRRLKKCRVDLSAAAPGVSNATVRAINRMLEVDPAKRQGSHSELIQCLCHSHAVLKSRG